MKLTVQVRTTVAKKVKALRKEGLLPAVVYGKSLKEPVLLSCQKNDFIKVYREAGFSTPIELTGGIEQMVLLQDLQVDPVSDEVLTVDFLAVSKNEKVSAQVPLVLVGESQVEKLNEGSIELVKDMVEVEAYPQDLPRQIEVDISVIESVNDTLFVRDLKVSTKVQILDAEDQPIVTVVELTDEEEKSAEETPAGSETATPASETAA